MSSGVQKQWLRYLDAEMIHLSKAMILQVSETLLQTCLVNLNA